MMMNHKKIVLSLSLLCCAITASAQGYTSVDVDFKGTDTLRYAGTLTLPKGAVRPPVAIILSGTGPQDRDGTMAGHKIFSQIADYLSTHGVAILRTDDRGVGGTYEEATTEDFATDALAAVSFLSKRKDIDTARIGLIGHSEGGAAAAIAASRSEKVKFIVSMAGLCMTGLQALITQNEQLVDSYPLPDYDKKRYNTVDELMFRVAYKYAQSDSMETKLNEAYQKWAAMDSIYFSTLGVEFDHFRFPIYSYLRQATGKWYRFHVRYNPAEYLAKLNIPVLALGGDKDVMVNATINNECWRRYMPAGTDVTTKILPNLNHLFLRCETGLPDEYYKLEDNVSTDALEIITRWILSH